MHSPNGVMMRFRTGANVHRFMRSFRTKHADKLIPAEERAVKIFMDGDMPAARGKKKLKPMTEVTSHLTPHASRARREVSSALHSMGCRGIFLLISRGPYRCRPDARLQYYA